MYLITTTRIQILNGVNVIKEIPLKKEIECQTEADVKAYRDKQLEKYRDKILKQYAKKHPDHEPPKVEILLNVKANEFYIQKARP